jgi:predicted ester cyclase
MLDENRSLLARWFDEVWNHEREETIRELMGSDCVIHDGETDICGPKEFQKFWEAQRAACSDIRLTMHEVVGEGDLVAARWSVEMRDRNSGKPLRTSGMSLVRFQDGRFAEAWQSWDKHGLMEQMQALTAAAAV